MRHRSRVPVRPRAGAERSFVTFILEPLYKLTATVVGEHPKTIERLLGEEFGIYLKSSAYSQDVKPLLKEVRRGALWRVCCPWCVGCLPAGLRLRVAGGAGLPTPCMLLRTHACHTHTLPAASRTPGVRQGVWRRVRAGGHAGAAHPQQQGGHGQQGRAAVHGAAGPQQPAHAVHAQLLAHRCVVCVSGT
jgi:hypothetical protein